MDNLKRDRGLLSINECKMIINVHKYFLDCQQGQRQQKDMPLRKLVATVLGIGEASVARAVAKWNKSKNKELIEHKSPGRPKKEIDSDIAYIIHSLVIPANTSGTPLSTPVLWQLLEEKGYNLSKWQLLRILHALGYFYSHGECRNILHESARIVAFHGHYLRWRFNNLQGKNYVPARPEVFLDESYCHLHHTTNCAWVPSHGIVCSPGHGPLLVIFGAIIVMRNCNMNKIEGEIVSNSLLIWDLSIKEKSSSRGRKG